MRDALSKLEFYTHGNLRRNFQLQTVEFPELLYKHPLIW